MKNLHPIMPLGYVLHLFIMIYGGEKNTQKNPIGFIALLCGGLLALSLGVIGLLLY